MMMYNIKTILEHFKDKLRGKVITRVGNIKCPGNTFVYYPRGDSTTIGVEQLYKSSSGTHSIIMINSPTVRNQMRCVLPRHSCISYLENVKIYESALGAEYQEEIDHGFEVFSKFIDENILRNS